MGDIVGSVLDLFGFGPTSAQIDANQDAMRQSSANADRTVNLQREMFNKQIELSEPWRKAGLPALNRLSSGLAQGGEFDAPFSRVNWQTDPGYQFRLNEGMKALNNQAAARGGLISGNALKAATRYGQEMGSQEYQNAFNRYYIERDNRMNPLQSLANVGQTTATQQGQAGQQFGQDVGNTWGTDSTNQGNAMLKIGEARASGYKNIGKGINQAFGIPNAKEGK
jgi:hypothetical protein